MNEKIFKNQWMISKKNGHLNSINKKVLKKKRKKL